MQHRYLYLESFKTYRLLCISGFLLNGAFSMSALPTTVSRRSIFIAFSQAAAGEQLPELAATWKLQDQYQLSTQGQRPNAATLFLCTLSLPGEPDMEVVAKEFPLSAEADFRNESRMLGILAAKPDADMRFVKVFGAVASTRRIVLERLGPSLRETSKLLASRSQALNPVVRLRILIEVAVAFKLLYTTRFVTHRDLKADNVLLTLDWSARALKHLPDAKTVDEKVDKDNLPIVKIIDFDSATTVSRSVISGRGDHGHLWYNAPECRVPAHENPDTYKLPDYDREKADVWRFGLFAFEVWTGLFLDDLTEADAVLLTTFKQPKSAEAKAGYARFHKAPDDLVSLICRCWLLAPKGRPTFAELVTKLAEQSDSAAFVSAKTDKLEVPA